MSKLNRANVRGIRTSIMENYTCNYTVQVNHDFLCLDYLKGLRHGDFAVLGQFSAKSPTYCL